MSFNICRGTAFRQDRLRIRYHLRGRMLAAGTMIVERLHLGHALADFLDWGWRPSVALKLVSL